MHYVGKIKELIVYLVETSIVRSTSKIHKHDKHKQVQWTYILIGLGPNVQYNIMKNIGRVVLIVTLRVTDRHERGSSEKKKQYGVFGWRELPNFGLKLGDFAWGCNFESFREHFKSRFAFIHRLSFNRTFA